MKGESVRCGVCPTIFVKKMKSQLYCSRGCYVKAWPINNREKAAEKSRLRRLANPEWYAAREPGYHKAYRTKLLSKHPWKYLLTSARNRAIEKNIAFDLDDAWAKNRWTGCCEITGLPFQTNGERGPHPFSPSVDRKNAKLGYTKKNTRFVLWGCNAIKGVGTDADMFEIARALVRVAP